MNYTLVKDQCVSGFIDSPNGNDSAFFCLMSDSIPEPYNIFKPCFKMFLLALANNRVVSPRLL